MSTGATGSQTAKYRLGKPKAIYYADTGRGLSSQIKLWLKKHPAFELINSGKTGLAENSRNILFIMCDQLRFDYLSCNGHPHLETPHIDGLAEKGVNFVNL